MDIKGIGVVQCHEKFTSSLRKMVPESPPPHNIGHICNLCPTHFKFWKVIIWHLYNWINEIVI